MKRRDFLRAGLAGGAVLGGLPVLARQAGRGSVALIADPEDPVVSSAPGQWAIGELRRAVAAAGLTVLDRQDPARCAWRRAVHRQLEAPAAVWCQGRWRATRLTPADAPEGVALAAGSRLRPPGDGGVRPRRTWSRLRARGAGGSRRARVAGRKPRCGSRRPVVERPANGVRSVMRQFTSEPLDKPWYYDREMWPAYLDMLATHRFNRFHLPSASATTSCATSKMPYFLFAYPFLLDVPGYRVRATNLPDEERDRNLDTLRFIARQTVTRGLEFQLGIWMHGYRWPDSPRAQHTIEGLTPETHAAYCRDALTAVLRTCPEISSVALRTHGESGVPEGSYAFWRTIFDGVRALRTPRRDRPAREGPRHQDDRRRAGDRHAGQRRAEGLGGAPGAPVPPGGHPRERDAGRGTQRPGADDVERGRAQHHPLRLRRPPARRSQVHRHSPRVLRDAAPAALGRPGGCGGLLARVPLLRLCRHRSHGAGDVPGRRGTGKAGSRIGYADPRLEPRWDWQKYGYWCTRVGASALQPGDDAEVWRRHFGSSPAGRALESSLAHVSRILPIVSTSHMPSAACDAYWPEVVLEPADRAGVRSESLHRLAVAEDVPERQPAGPGAVLAHVRLRGGAAARPPEWQVLADRGVAVARGPGASRRAGSPAGGLARVARLATHEHRHRTADRARTVLRREVQKRGAVLDPRANRRSAGARSGNPNVQDGALGVGGGGPSRGRRLRGRPLGERQDLEPGRLAGPPAGDRRGHRPDGGPDRGRVALEGAGRRRGHRSGAGPAATRGGDVPPSAAGSVRRATSCLSNWATVAGRRSRRSSSAIGT